MERGEEERGEEERGWGTRKPLPRKRHGWCLASGILYAYQVHLAERLFRGSRAQMHFDSKQVVLFPARKMNSFLFFYENV